MGIKAPYDAFRPCLRDSSGRCRIVIIRFSPNGTFRGVKVRGSTAGITCFNCATKIFRGSCLNPKDSKKNISMVLGKVMVEGLYSDETRCHTEKTAVYETKKGFRTLQRILNPC